MRTESAAHTQVRKVGELLVQVDHGAVGYQVRAFMKRGGGGAYLRIGEATMGSPRAALRLLKEPARKFARAIREGDVETARWCAPRGMDPRVILKEVGR